MNPLADPEDLAAATQLINEYAANDFTTISLSEHARERKEGRIIPFDVMMNVLRDGTAVGVRSEIVGGVKRWSYQVKLSDKYGWVVVVTAIRGRMKLHVVTTFTDAD